MSVYILRRKKLGRTSCREIRRLSSNIDRCFRHDRLNPNYITPNDTVVRWGCTASVGTRSVINTSAAIHAVNNKLEFRRTLNDHELCPDTWFSCDEVPEYAFSGDNKVVLRPARHAQGRNLHVCSTPSELAQAARLYESVYISPLINKVQEYRVFVVQGRAVAVAQKTPADPSAVAWNVARGGRFDNVNWDNWPLRAVKQCIQAFNLTDLDFGGVDVMLDAEGTPYILEINSAPSLTSPYRQECMAKALDYLIQNGKDRIPLIEQRGGYRKFIHPAVCDRAQLQEN